MLRYERYVKVICDAGYNFTEFSEEELSHSFKQWLKEAAEKTWSLKEASELDGMAYFNALATGPLDYQPAVILAYGLMPLIPTSVICETTFSKYNKSMRNDRSTMGERNIEAYLLLTEYPYHMRREATKVKTERMMRGKKRKRDEEGAQDGEDKRFNVYRVRHLFPFYSKECDPKKQRPRMEKARAKCRERYRGEGRVR